MTDDRKQNTLPSREPTSVSNHRHGEGETTASSLPGILTTGDQSAEFEACSCPPDWEACLTRLCPRGAAIKKASRKHLEAWVEANSAPRSPVEIPERSLSPMTPQTDAAAESSREGETNV